MIEFRNGNKDSYKRYLDGRKAVKMDIQVGDIVKLKKQHPCGSHEWEVLRIGADFRVKCMGCEHQIMIPRKTLEKGVKEIVRKN